MFESSTISSYWVVLFDCVIGFNTDFMLGCFIVFDSLRIFLKENNNSCCFLALVGSVFFVKLIASNTKPFFGISMNSKYFL